MTHRVTGVESDQDSSAEHPLLAVHPISGRTAELVTYLVDHSTAESNLLRHWWSSGDVVMWDNRFVMHRGMVRLPG